MRSTRKALARLAGEALDLLQNIQTSLKRKISKYKGSGDIATKGDLEAEAFILDGLTKSFPGIPILTEESGYKNAPGDQVFIVDPLDGSTNFHRGHTYYSVAITLVEKGRPITAAAAVGEKREIYSASAGKGAFLNDQRIKTLPARLDDLSMVTLQSSYDEPVPPYVAWLYLNGGKIRNYGSSVGHICQIASQRIDLCIFRKMKVWDFAAPGLILLEAGGYLSNFQGTSPFPLDASSLILEKMNFSIIASNGKAHENLPFDLIDY